MQQQCLNWVNVIASNLFEMIFKHIQQAPV
jgi:hypothetical protein